MDAEKFVQETLATMEAGKTAKAGDNMTDDFKFSGPVPQPIGKAEFLALQGALIKALPDWKFNAKDFKVQGNKVVFTVKITGTHTATLGAVMPGMPAVPATGKKVALPQETITVTLRGDKMASFEVAQVPGGGLPGILTQMGVQMPH